MAFLVGPDDSEMAKFAREFAGKNKVILTTLNSSTLEECLPKLSEDTLIFIENGYVMDTRYHELLKDRVTVGNIPIISNGDLGKYTTMAIERRELVKDRVMVGNVGKKRAKAIQRRKIDKTFFHFPDDIEVTKEVDLNSATPTPRTTILTEPFSVTHPEPPSFHRVSQSEVTTTLALPMYSYAVSIDKQNFWISRSIVNTSCKVDITLKATETGKFVQFKVKYGMSATTEEDEIRMAKNENNARGFFNDSGDVFFFPGADPKKPDFPHDWDNEDTPNAPQATNFEVTKVSSSEGGINVSVGYPGGGQVGGSIGRNEETTTVRKDFSVRTSRTGRGFYYTALDDKKWPDHFDGLFGFKKVKEIADLAKSHYTFRTEGLFKGPRDCTDKIKCTLLFKPKFRLLRTNSITKWCYSLTLKQSSTIELDMGLVQPPTTPPVPTTPQ